MSKLNYNQTAQNDVLLFDDTNDDEIDYYEGKISSRFNKVVNKTIMREKIKPSQKNQGW